MLDTITSLIASGATTGLIWSAYQFFSHRNPANIAVDQTAFRNASEYMNGALAAQKQAIEAQQVSIEVGKAKLEEHSVRIRELEEELSLTREIAASAKAEAEAAQLRVHELEREIECLRTQIRAFQINLQEVRSSSATFLETDI